MKNQLLFGFSIIATGVFAQANDRPNVVFVVGDDVGYGDLSCYGAEKIQTPNLDRLASDGCRFTAAHSSAATSTPARYALLTGTYGFRSGMDVLPGDAAMSIPEDKMTLPMVFQKAGYETAVVGKWHLGLGRGKIDWNQPISPSPNDVGFDYSFIIPATNDRVPCVYVQNGSVVNADPDDPITVDYKNPILGSEYPDGRRQPETMAEYPSSHGHNMSVINGIGRIGYMKGGKKALWNDETIADTLLGEAVNFIEKHRTEPFFLMFNSNDIHVPRVPHPRFRGVSQHGLRGDAMVQLDWCVGELMKTLDRFGLTENTIFIFTSDNGPVYDDGYRDGSTVHLFSKESDNGHDASGPWFGGKYDMREGGTCVPLIIRWPNRVKPASESDALAAQIDFLATFADWFSVPLSDDEALDSVARFDLFFNNAPAKEPQVLIEESYDRLSLRWGQWKYMEKGKKLFDLNESLEEKKNLRFQNRDEYEFASETLKTLKKIGVREWMKSVETLE